MLSCAQEILTSNFKFQVDKKPGGNICYESCVDTEPGDRAISDRPHRDHGQLTGPLATAHIIQLNVSWLCSGTGKYGKLLITATS